MDDAERDLLSGTERNRDRQLAWTRELIAIPTVNPYSGDDSAGSEAEVWIRPTAPCRWR